MYAQTPIRAFAQIIKFCLFYQFCLQIVSFRQQRLALTVTPVCLVAE